MSNDFSGRLLLEQGVYAVISACSLAGTEPVEVTASGAKSDYVRFAEVDDSVFWSMQFPDSSVTQCATSHTVRMNTMRADAVSGHLSTRRSLAGFYICGITRQFNFAKPL